MFHPREIFQRRSDETKLPLMISNLLYPPNGEAAYDEAAIADRNPSYMYPVLTDAGWFHYTSPKKMSVVEPYLVLACVCEIADMKAVRHYHPSMQSLMESRKHLLWKLEDMVSGRIP